MPTPAKGNDGRAARRMLWHRLFVVVMCFLGIIITLNLLGIGRAKSTSRAPAMRGRPSKQALNHHTNSGPTIVKVDIDNDEQVLDKILSASIHLVNIIALQQPHENDGGSSYEGVYGDFCELKFSIHKQDPSSVPMFRDLVSHSPDCDSVRYRVNLAEVAALARSFDHEDGALLGLTKNLELSGVVFHESRCGSTLVANALIGMNPTKHRVYSESAPPIVALRGICGESFQQCSLDTAAKILQDTLYLMGRSNDLQEERVFFKIQSVGTRSIQVFQTAFPNTPWMFVYRDPVQVLMSQLAQGSRNANCVRSRQQPSRSIDRIAKRAGYKNAHQLSNEEYCAAHLASLTESAVEALERAPDMGVAVNYASLPNILYDDILPNEWNVAVSDEEKENILKISGVYSKGRGNRAGEWHEDSAKKEERAPPAVHKAADLFLRDSFDLLQGETQHNDAF